MNKYLEFYGQKQVSPVKQDISEFDRHTGRRHALYRALGITPMTIKGKKVLEVGPGSGHNSIVTAMCSPAEYHLVEPNKTGYEEMRTIFGRYDFKDTKLLFNNLMLEDFKESDFDIVLCEGLLPGLDNKTDFLNLLKSKAEKTGSILVITCIDCVSIFFENTRRYLAKVILDKQGITDFDEQVSRLSGIFEGHLKTLKGVSRFTADWVIDAILNPAAANHDFSFADAMEILRDDFYYFGASPDFFTNTMWYKHLPADCQGHNSHYETQFFRIWHNFIHYQLSEHERDEKLNFRLYELCTEFNLKVNSFISGEKGMEPEIYSLLGRIADNMKNCEAVGSAIDEFISILDGECFDAEEMLKKYPGYCASFGRGQQYFSFVKG